MSQPQLTPQITSQELPAIDGRALESLAAVVLERSGLTLPDDRRNELSSWLKTRIAEVGLDNFDQYLTLLTAGPLRGEEFQAILEHVSPSTAAFFDHERQLKAFESSILPSLLEARKESRQLRLFCPACGRGETAYTLAMIVHRCLGVRLMDWCVEIYGCDLNHAAIDAASRGVYGSEIASSVPEIVRLRYFTQHGERYAVNDEITQMLGFEAIDLRDRAGIARHGSWDAIVCRDTLGHFEPQIREVVLGMFHDLLADDGVLMVGESEILPIEATTFTPLPDRAAAAYRKV